MTKTKNSVIFFVALIIYTTFILFFFLGLEIYTRIYYAVLGKPEELDGLLLLFTSSFLAIISGFAGSIIALTSSVIYLVKKSRDNPQKRKISVISGLAAYILFIIFIIVTMLVIKALHTPCPNCYK